MAQLHLVNIIFSVMEMAAKWVNVYLRFRKKTEEKEKN